jgi:hypothetical protein
MSPCQGNVWQRWSREKLPQVAVEQGLVMAISPSTIRRWGRQDRLKPWHDHAWQDSTDPHVVEKASSVLASVAEVNQHPKPN